jgi:hypothetical protein
LDGICSVADDELLARSDILEFGYSNIDLFEVMMLELKVPGFINETEDADVSETTEPTKAITKIFPSWRFGGLLKRQVMLPWLSNFRRRNSRTDLVCD